MSRVRQIVPAVFVALLAAALLATACGAWFVWSGVYDVGADRKDNALIAWVVHRTYLASLHRHAGNDVPPADLMSLENIRAGARFYAATCAACHGAPGRPLGPVGAGIQPAAPKLLAATRRNSPVEMFWVIKHGVNMTAMPSFGKTQSDTTLWQTAAFLFSARGIDRREYDALTGADNSGITTPAAGVASPAR